jgi:transcriptional regulator with XRE-family HTH domain
VICARCDSNMRQSVEGFQYLGSPLRNIRIERCIVYSCDKCGNRFEALPNPETAAREIVRGLILQKFRLDGRSILFVRKAMRLTAEALADLIGVDRVSVSRWENDHAPIDGKYDFRLRAAAIDRVLATPYDGDIDDLRRRLYLIMQHTYDSSKDASCADLTISVMSPRSSNDALPVEYPEAVDSRL